MLYVLLNLILGTQMLLAQTNGDIEYDILESRFEYYDGTQWRSMGNGSTGTPCVQAAGIEYNSTQNRLEFCDGAFWQSMMGNNTLAACSEAGQWYYDLGASDYLICNGTNLFQTKDNELVFTTVAQNLHNKLCSDVVTVETQFDGAAVNVGADLTVNLSGTGYVYYNDAQCSDPLVGSPVITSGSSSVNFYFRKLDVGSETLTASATNWSPAIQSQTTTFNPYVWTGGASPDTFWSTAGNWSGGTPPGSSDVAVFDGSCSVNCSPSLNASMSVGGIRMESDYTGTFTQGNFDISLNNLHWVQLNGTFTGGSASNTDVRLGTSGWGVITGGTLQFPGGDFRVNDWTVRNSPTLNFYSTSTFYVYNTLGDNEWHNLDPGTTTYQNVKWLTRKGRMILNDNWIIGGDFEFGDTAPGSSYWNFSRHDLYIAGDVTQTSGGAFATENGIRIRLTGNASGQTFTGGGSTDWARVPRIVLDTGANNVTLAGAINTTGLQLISAGTVTVTASTFCLCTDNIVHDSPYYDAGNLTFNNFKAIGRQQNFDFNGAVLTVTGDFTYGDLYNGTYNLNNGDIKVAGNVAYDSNSTSGGSLTIEINGSGAQTWNAGNVPNGNITVNKSGGTLTLASNMNLNGAGQDLTITSGTVDMAGFALTVTDTLTIGAGTTLTQNGGTLTYGSLVNNGTLNP